MTEVNPSHERASSSSRDDAIAAYKRRVEGQKVQSPVKWDDPNDTDATLADKISGLAREKDAERRSRRGNSNYRLGYDSRLFRPEGRIERRAVYASMAAIVTAATVGTPALTDATYGEERARQYVEQMGFEDVTHSDTDWFFVSWQGCSGADSIGYRLKASSHNSDEVVELLVCKGLLKNATLREG